MVVLPPCPETLNLRGLHLFHYALSHHCKKVRLCLEEKNLPWREHHVDLFKQENLDEDFLRINPNGTVPVLIHDGQIYAESNDIIRYLDAEFPDPPLTPHSNSDRILMDRLIQMETRLHRSISVLQFHFYFRGAPLHELKHLKAAQRVVANKDLADFYRAAKRGFSRRYLQGRISEIRRPLQYIEDLLKESRQTSPKNHSSSSSSLATLPPSPSILGVPFLTQADLVWVVAVQTFIDIGIPLSEYPHLLKWHRDISRKESFKRSQSSSFKLWLKCLLSVKGKIQRFLGWGVRGCEYSIETMWLLPTLTAPLPCLWYFFGPRRLHFLSPPVSRREFTSTLFVATATAFSLALLKAHLAISPRIPTADVANMRALTIMKRGGPDVLRFEEEMPIPRLRGTDEVLIRVMASSVSPADLEIQAGFGLPLYNMWRKLQGLPVGEGREFPLILGRDVAGKVEAVGSTVTLYKPGDDVYAATDYAHQGALADYVIVKDWQLARKPENISYEEAASLPHVAVEAWAALVDKGGLDPYNCCNKRILIHAGSGGFGSIAIQLVKAWGGHVTTTCGPLGVAFVKDLGADEIVDISGDHFEDALMHKPKFDLVINTLGPWACDSCLYLCKEDGKVVTMLPPILMMTNRYGLLAGSLLSGYYFLRTRIEQRIMHKRHYRWMLYGKPYGAVLAILKDLVEDGKVLPIVDGVYSMDTADLAFEKLRQGTTLGKNVIRISESEVDYLADTSGRSSSN